MIHQIKQMTAISSCQKSAQSSDLDIYFGDIGKKRGRFYLLAASAFRGRPFGPRSALVLYETVKK